MKQQTAWPELTPAEESMLDGVAELHGYVVEYRTAHNIRWGGPPYSAEEYAYIKGRVDGTIAPPTA